MGKTYRGIDKKFKERLKKKRQSRQEYRRTKIEKRENKDSDKY